MIITQHTVLEFYMKNKFCRIYSPGSYITEKLRLTKSSVSNASWLTTKVYSVSILPSSQHTINGIYSDVPYEALLLLHLMYWNYGKKSWHHNNNILTDPVLMFNVSHTSYKYNNIIRPKSIVLGVHQLTFKLLCYLKSPLCCLLVASLTALVLQPGELTNAMAGAALAPWLTTLSTVMVLDIVPITYFKENCHLAIPTCITARASRTCRDAWRGRYPVLTEKTFLASTWATRNLVIVFGKRPMTDQVMISLVFVSF